MSITRVFETMKNRIRIICILALLPIIVSCKSLLNLGVDPYIYFCEYRGGYWGEWDRSYTCAAKGTVDSFVLYADNTHPSEWGMKVTVYGLNSSKDLESDKWDTFSGLFEFYSRESTASKAAQNVIRTSSFSYLRSPGSNHYSRSATIKAQKGFGCVIYNVFFDDVGIGIKLPVSY